MDDAGHIRDLLKDVPDPMALLEGLFALSPVAFQIYTAEGRSLLVNRAFVELFGSEPPPEYNVLKDEIAAEAGVLDVIRRAFAGETIRAPPIWYDARTLRQVTVTHGRRVAVAATFFPLRDRDGNVTHVAIAFSDLTAEKLARDEAESRRAEAERQKQLLELIIRDSPVGVVVCDDRGILRVFNAEAQRQHGGALQEVHPPEWAKTYGLQTLTGAPLPLEETPLYRALQGHPTEGLCSWKVRRPDGSERILAGAASAVRNVDGTIAGAVLITRDETERVTREDELRLRAEFEKHLMAVVGHDLRSPLQAILLGATTLMRKPGMDAATKKTADRIRNSAERANRLIRDLTDFTRAHSGAGLPINPQKVDLREVVTETLSELEAAHPDAKVEVEHSGSVVGTFDRDRIAQLLTNLVDNAVKYGASDSPVRVRTEQTDHHIALEVTNRGEPIPADLLPRVFEPYYRGGDAQRSSAGRSLGLGLYIVRHIAQAHGGRVEARSSREDGTTFRVVLPLTAAGG